MLVVARASLHPRYRYEKPALLAPSAALHTRETDYSWAELRQRVFAIDVLDCPACHGCMRILATIRSETAIRAILECLELPSRAPPISPAGPEPEFAGGLDLDRDRE